MKLAIRIMKMMNCHVW